jgi:hypothetical protein
VPLASGPGEHEDAKVIITVGVVMSIGAFVSNNVDVLVGVDGHRQLHGLGGVIRYLGRTRAQQHRWQEPSRGNPLVASHRDPLPEVVRPVPLPGCGHVQRIRARDEARNTTLVCDRDWKINGKVATGESNKGTRPHDRECRGVKTSRLRCRGMSSR